MFLFVTLFPTFGGKKNRFLRQVHPYSGLDPQTWHMFQGHLSVFEDKTRSIQERAAALYASVEDVRNLALFIRRADDHEHQEKLEQIATEIGIEGEEKLFEIAQKSGVYFFPKYLNDTLQSVIEYADGYRSGNAVLDHFPDPRSHGQ
jgi:hypothetical protein